MRTIVCSPFDKFIGGGLHFHFLEPNTASELRHEFERLHSENNSYIDEISSLKKKIDTLTKIHSFVSQEPQIPQSLSSSSKLWPRLSKNQNSSSVRGIKEVQVVSFLIVYL